MDTTTDDAIRIIERHYGNAWRNEAATRMLAERGRYTKAKRHAAEIARAKADAIKRLVDDLRAAGYTITED